MCHQNFISILFGLFFITITIKPIITRDSKISPELRGYSKFENESNLIKIKPQKLDKIDISNNLNKLFLKDDLKEDSIDNLVNNENHNSIINTTISSEKNGVELTDNQTNLLDLIENSSVNSTKLVNETINELKNKTANLLNSTAINSISQTKINKSFVNSNQNFSLINDSPTVSHPLVTQLDNKTLKSNIKPKFEMPNLNQSELDVNLKTNKSNDSVNLFDSFIYKPCYSLSEIKKMNCSSCFRCTVILNHNKSADLDYYKVQLVFVNKNFNIMDFLIHETNFRNIFELKIKSALKINDLTIIYEYPFPIINSNQTIFTVLVLNKTLEVLKVDENDIKDNLMNASLISEFFFKEKSQIENIFKMNITCIDNEFKSYCASIARIKFTYLFTLLEIFIGFVLLTTIILLIILCSSRSKSRKHSTKLKPFSELDNNLEYHFYDSNERNLGSPNAIRLQYLNRISENEFNPYHFSNNSGIDLVKESDIIREENLHHQLIKNHYQNLNQNNGSFLSASCSTLTKLTNGKNSNEKRIFYNPKYERKLNVLNDNPNCNHLNTFINQKNLANHHFSKNQNLNQNFLSMDRNGSLNYGLNSQTEDCSENCDLKFMNCNCAKFNKNEDNMAMNLIKKKPPSGKSFFKKDISIDNCANLEIVDTKL